MSRRALSFVQALGLLIGLAGCVDEPRLPGNTLAGRCADRQGAEGEAASTGAAAEVVVLPPVVPAAANAPLRVRGTTRAAPVPLVELRVLGLAAAPTNGAFYAWSVEVPAADAQAAADEDGVLTIDVIGVDLCGDQVEVRCAGRTAGDQGCLTLELPPAAEEDDGAGDAGEDTAAEDSGGADTPAEDSGGETAGG